MYHQHQLLTAGYMTNAHKLFNSPTYQACLPPFRLQSLYFPQEGMQELGGKDI